MNIKATEWIEEELAGIDLGDRRLNKRCRRFWSDWRPIRRRALTAPATAGPKPMPPTSFSITRRSMNSSSGPPPPRTLERMKSLPVVLLVQDTTELDYTRIKKKLAGAGPLDKQYRRGFYNHLQVAFTPQRLCLGVVSMQFWARDDETFDTCKQRKHTRWKKRKVTAGWRAIGTPARSPKSCRKHKSSVFRTARAIFTSVSWRPNNRDRLAGPIGLFERARTAASQSETPRLVPLAIANCLAPSPKCPCWANGSCGFPKRRIAKPAKPK